MKLAISDAWAILTEAERSKCLREAEYLVSSGFAPGLITEIAEKLAQNLAAAKQAS